MKNDAPKIIRLVKIEKSYYVNQIAVPVIQNLSLDITLGDMVAILGQSGSGKSTLMNIIGLLDHDYQGEYWLHGKKMTIVHDDELARLRNQNIGFVFQQFHLLARLNAVQNVALPMLYRGLSPEESEHLAFEALSRVQMTPYAKRRPSQLSGGQQQRIAIARALVGQPDVILADEPTGALDSKTSQEIMDLFHTLHQEGRTIILITHEEQIAMQCMRKIVIQDGKIIMDQRI
jgi:putative ABC transport system ATP-binding protein